MRLSFEPDCEKKACIMCYVGSESFSRHSHGDDGDIRHFAGNGGDTLCNSLSWHDDDVPTSKTLLIKKCVLYSDFPWRNIWVQRLSSQCSIWLQMVFFYSTLETVLCVVYSSIFF